MFMAALFTLAKIWKQPKCPSMDKGIKKMRLHIYIYVYIYNGILLGHKKEWYLTICDSMDGPRGYYVK